MGPRLAILLGLLAGVVAGGALLAVYVISGPASTPSPGTAASASVDPSSPAGTGVASPSLASPSLASSPSGSAPPSPSGSAPASPGGSEGALATPAATDLGAAFHVGEPAPALKVARLGGGEVDLAALRGKPVWLVFMATWCPSCQDEFR